MPATEKTVRKSVSVPAAIAKRVRTLAKAGRTSESRILVELIETGLATRDEERRHFQVLVDRLAQAKSKAEQTRLKKELAQLTFGN